MRLGLRGWGDPLAGRAPVHELCLGNGEINGQGLALPDQDAPQALEASEVVSV